MWIFLFLNSLFAGNYLKNLTIIIKKIKSYHCLFIGKKFYSMIIVFIVIRIKPLACRKKRVGDAIHMSYMLATTKPRYLCFPQLVYWRELVSGFVQVRDVKQRLTK